MTTVLSATIDPTDRSIPPAAITIVIPRAATQTITAWRAISSRLAARRNRGADEGGEQRQHEDQADERAALVEQPSRVHEEGSAPDAAMSSACSVHAEAGRGASSRPRDITAMRSQTPTSSGR